MTSGVRLEHDWFSEPLPPNVAVGDRSWLYSSFAFRHFRSERPTAVRIGSDSGVYNGSFFDLGPDGEVHIGDFCAIVGAVFATNARVEVHDYAFVAHEVTIADVAIARPGGDSSGAPRLPIIIGENAWIGARATLLGGAHIGRGAIVGAGAVVTDAVPEFAIAAGNPARVVADARPQGNPNR